MDEVEATGHEVLSVGAVAEPHGGWLLKLAHKDGDMVVSMGEFFSIQATVGALLLGISLDVAHGAVHHLKRHSEQVSEILL